MADVNGHIASYLKAASADALLEVSPVDGYFAKLADAGVGGGGGISYRMRGRDTTLARYVYWNSLDIDSTGTDYAGPGPLTDVVVSDKTP